MTTLDDLKRAIEAVPELSTDVKAYVYQTARADAWRAAFEWRNHYIIVPSNADDSDAAGEFAEGMRLIREKLS